MLFGQQQAQAFSKLLNEFENIKEYNTDQQRRFRSDFIPLVRMLFDDNREYARVTQNYRERLESSNSRVKELKYLIQDYDQQVKKVQREVANIIEGFNQRTMDLRKKIVNRICDFNKAIEPFEQGEIAFTKQLTVEEGHEIEIFTRELVPQVKSTAQDVNQLAHTLFGWAIELGKSSKTLINGSKREINNFARFKSQDSATQRNSEHMRIYARVGLANEAESEQLTDMLFKGGWIADMDSRFPKIQRRKLNLGIVHAYTFNPE